MPCLHTSSSWLDYLYRKGTFTSYPSEILDMISKKHSFSFQERRLPILAHTTPINKKRSAVSGTLTTFILISPVWDPWYHLWDYQKGCLLLVKIQLRGWPKSPPVGLLDCPSPILFWSLFHVWISDLKIICIPIGIYGRRPLLQVRGIHWAFEPIITRSWLKGTLLWRNICLVGALGNSKSFSCGHKMILRPEIPTKV